MVDQAYLVERMRFWGGRMEYMLSMNCQKSLGELLNQLKSHWTPSGLRSNGQ